MSDIPSYKVVLLGESGVGKTCIINQYIKNEFDVNTMSSLTAQFVKKQIKFADGKIINFDLWDTAGQEKYRSLAKIFYKDANVVILVYDITNEKSFNEMKNYWFEKIKETNNENVIVAIAGNKGDLYNERQVKTEEAEKFAKENKAIFASISAKSDIGIDALFQNIGRKIIDPDYDFFEEQEKMEKKYQKNKKKQRKKEEYANRAIHIYNKKKRNKKSNKPEDNCFCC